LASWLAGFLLDARRASTLTRCFARVEGRVMGGHVYTTGVIIAVFMD
jgi:hypothetical protein